MHSTMVPSPVLRAVFLHRLTHGPNHDPCAGRTPNPSASHRHPPVGANEPVAHPLDAPSLAHTCRPHRACRRPNTPLVRHPDCAARGCRFGRATAVRSRRPVPRTHKYRAQRPVVACRMPDHLPDVTKFMYMVPPPDRNRRRRRLETRGCRNGAGIVVWCRALEPTQAPVSAK